MASQALVPHVCHDAPLRQDVPGTDGRPILLLVGDETGDHGGWARRGIERRYRMLSVPTGDGRQVVVPSGARGVVTFHEAAADRALSLAESAGLPTAALRTAVRRRAAGTRGSTPSREYAPDTALTAVVVSAVLDGTPFPLSAAAPRECHQGGPRCAPGAWHPRRPHRHRNLCRRAGRRPADRLPPRRRSARHEPAAAGRDTRNRDRLPDGLGRPRRGDRPRSHPAPEQRGRRAFHPFGIGTLPHSRLERR
jgi:hypothetical protein